jgi:hypothetical protein
MKQTIIAIAAALALTATVCFGAATLPEEGLKRAQEAEKLVKQDKIAEAVQILQKLDEDHPGHAAVSLRLAQILDQNNLYGPALFYYRRYVRIKGGGAADEVRSRVTSIEMMPGASEEAGQYAAQLGENTEAVPVPTPDVKESIERPAVDGSLVPVTKPEDLAKAQITPLPAGRQTPDPAEAAARRAVITPFAGNQPAVLGDEPEDIRIGAAPAQPPARTLPPSLSGQTRIEPVQTPALTAGTPAARAFPTDSQFFKVTRASGSDAVVKLTNQVQNSVLTFAAVSEGRRPVNAVLMAGETRDLKIAPGEYEVTVNVTEHGYVPTTVMDQKFEQRFEAGRVYSRRIATTGE